MTEMIYSRKFAAGEVIFRAGETGRDAYVIESGRVQISLPRERANENVFLAELGPGEIFGEMSMIDDAPRSATVTAIEETEVIVILRARFVRPLHSANPLMSLIVRVVLARFRDAQHRLIGNKNSPVKASLDQIRALALDRLGHERAMRRGLKAGEFVMHYQPIISLETGQIAGFEALMRWRQNSAVDGEAKLLSPGHFIPKAEETGLIVELGRMALEHGLRDRIRLAAACREAGLADPFMSVNVSGLQLTELGEIDQLAALITESGTNPAAVKLEITETLMMQNFSHAAEALRKLKALGVSIAIDDFGTGYSSLSYLHQFPLDTLKIDRAFVTRMDQSESSRRVVFSIVQLALALDMDIVAEGIEDDAQLAALRELGCQFGQGFLFSEPLPIEDALALVAGAPRW